MLAHSYKAATVTVVALNLVPARQNKLPYLRNRALSKLLRASTHLASIRIFAACIAGTGRRQCYGCLDAGAELPPQLFPRGSRSDGSLQAIFLNCVLHFTPTAQLSSTVYTGSFHGVPKKYVYALN